MRIRKPVESEPSGDAAPSSGPEVWLLFAAAAIALALAAVMGSRKRLDRWRDATGSGNDPAKSTPFGAGREDASSLETEPPPAQADGVSEKRSMNGVRAVGYVSVPNGDSLKSPRLTTQMEAIDSLCRRRGWTLLEVVRDYEEPRGKALERPGLGYTLERVQRGEASCVVVSELRCLGRSLADVGRTLETIGRSRGRLVALDMGIDTAAPEGRKAANVLVRASAWERDRLAECTRKGLEAARANGGPVSRPSINDVPALKQRIAALRESGMTLQAIADRLNEEGVPTLRGGERWRPSSVQTAAGYRRPRATGVPTGGGSSNGRGTG
jgi:DNA invertase Pin-like site-specific DNA recombinase